MDHALPPRYARWVTLVLPELGASSPRERGRALRDALAAPFDAVELVALAVAALGAVATPPFAAALAALVVVHRTRRHLRDCAARGPS